MDCFSINGLLNHFPRNCFFIGVLLLGSSNHVISQIKDTSTAAMSIESHSPQKATVYSLICPGLGQVYNKKFWKLPIIYGAGAAFTYGFTYNQLKYKKFKEAVFNKESSSSKVLIDGIYYEQDVLYRGMRYYERNRDKCIIGFAAIYLLNIIDAMVDAYFFHFDMSDDLSMRLEPVLNEGPYMTASIGFRINLGF
ncbi:MAG: hypothetical protein JXB49_09795 [Bacteroidales bacterium]|nr:hypothetical protein [Bacteroidales bacterium]